MEIFLLLCFIAAMFLNSMYNIPEEELEESFSILPPHESPFTKLHTSDKNMQVRRCQCRGKDCDSITTDLHILHWIYSLAQH